MSGRWSMIESSHIDQGIDQPTIPPLFPSVKLEFRPFGLGLGLPRRGPFDEATMLASYIPNYVSGVSQVFGWRASQRPLDLPLPTGQCFSFSDLFYPFS
jgi:hypothetical protein